MIARDYYKEIRKLKIKGLVMILKLLKEKLTKKERKVWGLKNMLVKNIMNMIRS